MISNISDGRSSGAPPLLRPSGGWRPTASPEYGVAGCARGAYRLPPGLASLHWPWLGSEPILQLRHGAPVIDQPSNPEVGHSNPPPIAPGMFQTTTERHVASEIARVFEASSDTVEQRLANFPRYVRRSHLTRLLALYELFKIVLPVKGSIVECGVFRGFSFLTWAKLSAILEPNNLTRRIYGFDSFSGFPSVADRDEPARTGVKQGDLGANLESELRELMDLYDADRFLGHIPKVSLTVGDITETVGTFVASNPHLVVSLLFLDVDLYDPTVAALEAFLPRMPKGAVLAFDELDNPLWPGETAAALDVVGLSNLRLERFDFDPYIAFARL